MRWSLFWSETNPTEAGPSIEVQSTAGQSTAETSTTGPSISDPSTADQSKNAVQNDGSTSDHLPPPPHLPVSAEELLKQKNALPLKVRQYVRILIISLIPGINIIYLTAWSFGKNSNINRKNLSRAMLLIIFTVIGLWLAVGRLFPSLLVKLIEGL